MDTETSTVQDIDDDLDWSGCVILRMSDRSGQENGKGNEQGGEGRRGAGETWREPGRESDRSGQHNQ